MMQIHGKSNGMGKKFYKINYLLIQETNYTVKVKNKSF